jgi:hypothetical protein
MFAQRLFMCLDKYLDTLVTLSARWIMNGAALSEMREAQQCVDATRAQYDALRGQADALRAEVDCYVPTTHLSSQYRILQQLDDTTEF